MSFHYLGSDEDLGVTGCEGFEGLGLSEILQQALIKDREDNKVSVCLCICVLDRW